MGFDAILPLKIGSKFTGKQGQGGKIITKIYCVGKNL